MITLTDNVLDRAPCGFISFGDDGVVNNVNTTLLTMLGYERDDVIGKHVETIMPVGTRIFYQTHWFPLLKLHGRADEIFLMMRAKSGENVSMLSYTQRRPDDGTYDCIMVPVKERAKYEEELLRARRDAEQANKILEEQAVELELQQDLLEEANRAKSSFVAMMSHELRTPLNAISGYLEIMQMEIPGPLTDGQRDILDRLGKSSRHLLTLINDVLNLSRIESGIVEYEIAETTFGAVLDHIVPIVEPLAAKKHLDFIVNAQSSLRINVDFEKTTQILLNLIGNAVKFTAEGSIKVTTSTSEGFVHISVADTGPGIPADKFDAVFQPFVQVSEGRTAHIEGSGLGLAISRDFARGMGGDIRVESQLGVGTTFTVSLPSA